jgi:AcrR family transcriptional regulator
MYFLWQERAGGRRGPKPALTLDAIADAAIAIADAEGPAAVSMQRVAAEVG